MTDASLTARQVRFSTGDQRFMIVGRFAGSVDGGVGSDTINLSGGSATAPVSFADVEALAMTSGYATVSGTATFDIVDMSVSRLVDLADSMIAAGQIVVRQGASFGSAGTVNGNLSGRGHPQPRRVAGDDGGERQRRARLDRITACE